MSKVVLSPLLRAMLKDEKARQQLSEAIARRRIEVPQWAKDAQRKVIEWAMRNREKR